MKIQAEIIRILEKIHPVTDVCGEIRTLSTGEDFSEANLIQATIRAPTEPHYHRIATEFYFVEEGKGRLIVGKDSYEIGDGMLIILPPGVVHFTIPRKISRVLVFSVPAWTERDQVIVQGEDTVDHYSPFLEKFELINELLFRKGLGVKPEMTRWKREWLDTQRQNIVLRAGWGHMSIPELRKLLRIS